jgi:hypothetical protein
LKVLFSVHTLHFLLQSIGPVKDLSEENGPGSLFEISVPMLKKIQ